MVALVADLALAAAGVPFPIFSTIAIVYGMRRAEPERVREYEGPDTAGTYFYGFREIAPRSFGTAGEVRAKAEVTEASVKVGATVVFRKVVSTGNQCRTGGSRILLASELTDFHDGFQWRGSEGRYVVVRRRHPQRIRELEYVGLYLPERADLGDVQLGEIPLPLPTPLPTPGGPLLFKGTVQDEGFRPSETTIAEAPGSEVKVLHAPGMGESPEAAPPPTADSASG